MENEERQIAAVLAGYAEAANRSDVDAVLALFAADAVFMPQGFPSSVGAAAVRAAYAAVFEAVSLDIAFTVAEIRQLSPDWAMLRSTSSGTTTIRATGQALPEGNQELFLLQKTDGAWRIARYSFSTTLASAA